MTSRAPAAIVRFFSDRASAAVPEAAGNPALQAFSLDRIMGYGVRHADAVELRGRVADGEDWQVVANDLASICLSPPEASVAPATAATRANRLYRASALLRIGQILMVSDDATRREIFAGAADLFEQAAILSGDCERVIVDTEQGPLVGWFYPSKTKATAGAAVVIGGIEGWAMDFGAQGLELARRGVDALVLDGPGQGESRMRYDHYLTRHWVQSYQGAFDYLLRRTGGAPLALVGNSMGGVVALRLASMDARIAACCENCAPRGRGDGLPNPVFLKKVRAHCGDVPDAVASEIWSSVRPGPGDAPVNCPLLIVHGGLDPMVSDDAAQGWFDWATSANKQLVTYSNGDHCVYNHPDDTRNLIADWVADRLKGLVR